MTDAAPAPAPMGAPAPSDGKTLGVVALVVAFFFSVIGIILGFVAKGQSKRAGVKNTPATVAIVLGFIFLVVGIIIAVAVGGGVGALAGQCAEYGPGIHELPNGVTLTCG
ncbi:MAG: DUF4190 domain-containing protein [Rhodoglobus sp.]|nr:DUF4190 domain-containing protein [Rhodoglobus sp.]